jgi:hypothetical protein
MLEEDHRHRQGRAGGVGCNAERETLGIDDASFSSKPAGGCAGRISRSSYTSSPAPWKAGELSDLEAGKAQ